MDEIPGVIGRNVNYISYVASDTHVYIFIANRKNQYSFFHFLPTVPCFLTSGNSEALLGMPSPSANAREAFDNFQKTGYRLVQENH